VGGGAVGEKRTRSSIEAERGARVDESFDRHLSMNRRRGRKYDAAFVPPMRQLGTDNPKP